MIRNKTLDNRIEVHRAFITLFSQLVKLPVYLYIPDGDEYIAVKPPNVDDLEEEHCKYIKSFPGGSEKCLADQCGRVTRISGSREANLTICWAGMYNQAVPIKMNDIVKCVLLFGEMQVDDPEYKRQAETYHQQAVKALQLGAQEAARLRELRESARTFNLQELAFYKEILPGVRQGLFALYEDEDRFRQNVERVKHEIQIRLQAVMAYAENLLVEFKVLDESEALEMARSVLNSALALNTVVQDLGEYLEEYHFKPGFLRDLVEEAARIYGMEAANKGIDIRIRMSGNTRIIMSRHHLQLAINNLVNNAVKYSFRKAPGRQRYVDIVGRPRAGDYVFVVENYGVGILPEEIASGVIFTDGYQGKLTQGEYRTGTGKGLCFTKRVIEKHHGTIRVESRCMANAVDPMGEPHLTRFIVSLPYKQE